MSSSIAFLSRNHAATIPSRRWLTWLLPSAILSGFAAIFFILFQDRILPAVEVRVASVLVTSDLKSSQKDAASSGHQFASTLLFQASGWVEPDPYAVKATSLIDGVVADIYALEGQSVEKGALLASLVDDDVKLKLAAAEGRLRVLTAEKKAQVLAVAAGRSKHAAIQSEVLAVATVESEAKDHLNRYEGLKDGGAVSEADVIAARLRLQREQANHTAAKARLEEQLAEITRLEAAITTKDEEIALARFAVAQEQLALERTKIPAPITGRVLRLTAIPGEKKMLAMDHPDSSTIAVLYDPLKLQVRVDVPLADAARLQIGQKTKVYSNVLPDQVFEGEVTRISGEADLQRNTLQAKVRIISSPDVLRPEMLCRVEFWGTTTGADNSQHDRVGDLALWIPAEALSGNVAWVFDADTNRINKREVTASTERREDYVRIQDGLRPGEQVVLSPDSPREDQRVTPLFTQP